MKPKATYNTASDIRRRCNTQQYQYKHALLRQHNAHGMLRTGEPRGSYLQLCEGQREDGGESVTRAGLQGGVMLTLKGPVQGPPEDLGPKLHHLRTHF